MPLTRKSASSLSLRVNMMFEGVMSRWTTPPVRGAGRVDHGGEDGHGIRDGEPALTHVVGETDTVDELHRDPCDGWVTGARPASYTSARSCAIAWAARTSSKNASHAAGPTARCGCSSFNATRCARTVSSASNTAAVPPLPRRFRRWNRRR
jgi:hypothetical protein